MSAPTINDLRKFSDGNGNFEFNFSQLPSNYYPQLFSVLMKFPTEEIISLTFSCNNIKQSKSGKFVKLGTVLCNFLKDFLPTQLSLEDICFKKIQFSPELYSIIGSSVSNSSKISIVTFENIPIGDNNLKSLLTTINPNLIQDLNFNNCSITNKSRDYLIDLLKRRTQCVQGYGLSSFVVNGPEFTIQSEINQIIDDAHANDVNEEEEEEFDAETTKPPQTSLEDDTQTKDKQSLTLSSTILNNSMEEEIFEEEEEEIAEEEILEEKTNEREREAVIEENKKLRALIKILRDMPNPINFGEKDQQVIAIGPGSKRFEQHLFALAKAAKV